MRKRTDLHATLLASTLSPLFRRLRAYGDVHTKMHYWGLFGVIVTAVGADSGCRRDSALVVARQFPGRFDVSATGRIKSVKTVTYTSDERIGDIKKDEFSYSEAPQDGELIKRDAWIPIPAQYVDVDDHHLSHDNAAIHVSELSLDPDTVYIIGYQVDDSDEDDRAESYPFRVATTDDSSSSTISDSMVTTATPSLFSDSILSLAYTPISTVAQASTTAPASSTSDVSSSDPSGNSDNTGSGAPGMAHGPLSWFWSSLLLALFKFF